MSRPRGAEHIATGLETEDIVGPPYQKPRGHIAGQDDVHGASHEQLDRTGQRGRAAVRKTED